MPKRGEKRSTPAEETETEREWRALLAEQSKRGLGTGEFAAMRGVRAAALTWWRSEIARRDRDREQARASTLLPVRVTGMFASAPSPALEVVIRGGERVVRVPPGADLTQLRAVVEALEA
jgi:hypothetical protein